jgi:predicted phosphodiesterase
MNIAVISDIHGNIFALKAVLEDIKNRNVDTIICLGDLVGYGPFPNEVID